MAYHHHDRTHIGLNKATPTRRPIELRPTDTNRIQTRPRIGGLHHRCYWAEAAWPATEHASLFIISGHWPAGRYARPTNWSRPSATPLLFRA